MYMTFAISKSTRNKIKTEIANKRKKKLILAKEHNFDKTVYGDQKKVTLI